MTIYLRKLLYLITALVVLTITLAIAALYQPNTVLYLSHYLQSNVEGLVLENPEGTLAEKINFTAIEYSNGSTAVSFKNASIEPGPLLCILSVRACIDNIRADTIAISLAQDSTKQSNALPSITSPLPIVIKQLDLGSAEIFVSKDETYEIKDLKASLKWFLRKVELKNVKGVYLHKETADEFVFDLGGHIKLHKNYPLAAEIQVNNTDRELDLTLDIKGDLEKSSISGQLNYHTPLSFKGTIKPLNNMLPWQLDISIPQFKISHDKYGISAFDGTLAKLTGNKISLSGNASSSMNTELWDHSTPISVDFALDREQLSINKTIIKLPSGNLESTGSIQFLDDYEKIMGDFDITLNNLNPDFLYSSLTGMLDGKTSVSINAKNISTPSPHIEIQATNLLIDGVLLNAPFSHTASVNWSSNKGIRVNHAQVIWGKNTVQLEKPWFAGEHAGLIINLPKIDTFTPLLDKRIAGSAEGYLSFSTSQSLYHPFITGNLSFNNIEYDQLNITRATFAFARQNEEQHIVAHSINESIGNLAASCSVLSESNAIEHFIHCDNVHWKPPTLWKLKSWVNTNTISAVYNKDEKQINIDPFCLIEDGQQGFESSLCINSKTTLPSNDIAIDANLSHFSLANIQYWLPNHSSLKGLISAHLKLNLLENNLSSLLIKARGSNGILSWNNTTQNIEIPLTSYELNANGTPKNMHIQSNIETRGYGLVHANLDIKDSNQLNGKLDIQRMSLTSLAPLIPNVHTLEGYATANISIKGTQNAPSIEGHLKAHDIVYKHSTQPYLINSGILNATFNQHQSNFESSFKIDEDPASLTGSINWLNNNYKGEFKFTSDEIHLTPLPHSELWVKPTLTINLTPTDINLSGTLEVPKAYIRIDTLPKEMIDVSSDTWLTNTTSPKGQGTVINSSIALTMGDNVLFRGFGLDTNLKGNLGIRHRTDQPIFADGIVKFENGTYKSYGQNLSIRNGELLFTGDINNPTLRVDAIRPDTTDGTLVGVQVAGNANNPRVTLFSQPAMTDQSKLHYLLTGEAPNNTALDKNEMLSKAVVSLGAALGDTALQEYAESAGIKHFQIGANNGDGGTEIQLSGYLNPRLYVRYGRGVFEEVNSLTMKYQLRKNLFLETVSSTISTLDLLWVFKIHSAARGQSATDEKTNNSAEEEDLD